MYRKMNENIFIVSEMNLVNLYNKHK